MPPVKNPKAIKAQKFFPYAKGFHLPTNRDKSKALGETAAPEFSDSVDFFPPIPQCTSGNDWLAQYNEEGQSYDEYLVETPWLSKRKLSYIKQTFNSSGRTLPEKYPDGKIYILPLGEFDSDSSPRFDELIEHAQLFFCMPVKKLPAAEFEHKGRDTYLVDENSGENGNRRRLHLTSRFHDASGRRQLRVQDILQALRSRLPDDGLCLLALTMSELYETKTDLFVAGMAAGRNRVAVFSLLRYDPNLSFSQELWYDIHRNKQCNKKERARLLLLRSCRLLVHETSHLLGIGHCVYYSCVMNGSGHLEEDFRQPMHLCPVDLRKLHILCGFDVVGRYKGLHDFFQKHAMTEEADWIKRRIKFIRDDK